MNAASATFKPRSLLAAGMILVIIGLLGGLKAYYQHRPPTPVRGGFLERTAILSGIEERVDVPEFSGGNLTAILGGFSLDLRGVQTPQDPIRLNVTAICGGGEIRVPEGWTVSVQVRTIAGGVEQKLQKGSKDDSDDADDEEGGQDPKGTRQVRKDAEDGQRSVVIVKKGSDGSKEIRIRPSGKSGDSAQSIVIVRKDAEDRSKAEAQGALPSKHHLIVEGLVFCGGLEVKH